MFLVYILISVTLIRIIWKQGNNLFNPLIIYIFIWVFLVSLYELRLIPYNPTIIKTWLVLIFAPIFLCLGYSFTHFILPKKYTIPKINNDKVIYLKIFIYLLGFLLVFRTISVWLDIYFHFGSFTSAFTNGDEIYNKSRFGNWAPGLGFYIPVDYLSMFLIGIYQKVNKKVDWLVIIIIFSAIFLNLGLQSRLSLMMSFTIYFGSYMGSNEANFNIKLSSMLKIIFVGIGLISIISLSRNLAELNSVSGEWGDFNDTFLPSLYFYLTNGFAGLIEYLKIGEDETTFLYTFNPLLRFYGLIDSSISVDLYESKYYYTPIRTIIATWIRFLIDDFGYVGTFLQLFFYGALLKFSEFKLKNIFSFFWISIYSHILMMFTLSFFSYTFFLSSFWYSLIISCSIGLIIDSSVGYILFNNYIKK